MLKVSRSYTKTTRRRILCVFIIIIVYVVVVFFWNNKHAERTLGNGTTSNAISRGMFN